MNTLTAPSSQEVNRPSTRPAKRSSWRRVIVALATAGAISGAAVAMTAASASALPRGAVDCYALHNGYLWNASQASFNFGSYTTAVVEGDWASADSYYTKYLTYMGAAGEDSRQEAAAGC